MEMTPALARHILAHVKYGLCRHCGECYYIRKDGKLRKHGCDVDYPTHGMIPADGEATYIQLDCLAEIVNAG